MRGVDHQPSVLMTEGDAIVAMDLVDALERASYRVLGPAGTAAEALALLGQETPTAAIIEVQLRDGSCSELARALRQAGVPFLVHSAREPSASLPPDFQGVPWLVKPVLPWDVVSLLDELSRPDRLSDEPRDVADRSSIPVDKATNPFVRKLEGFVALSDGDRAALERISANPRAVPPRTDLIREGDAPGGVFLVLEGMACRHKLRPNGTRHITAYLVPGDLDDIDVALLRAMDHTVTALSACKVVQIAPDVIADLMAQHPGIARALRLSTLVDAATLREWLVNVGCREALERVAHLFCELHERLAVVGLTDAGSYALPITQADLADTTGLSSVHMNRTLQELRRCGLIDMKRGRLTILDFPGLRALAEFKANYLHVGPREAA